MNNILTIKTYSRIHLGLIDLSGNGYRRNGGAGFSIDDPSITLRFSTSTDIDINELISHGFNENDIQKLSLQLKNTRKNLDIKSGVKIIKCEVKAQRHSGFGTGTAVTLASIEALLMLNGYDATPNTIKENSGRGGTSGIGIDAYFNGGLILDVGRKEDGSAFSPSSAASHTNELPLTLIRTEMPPWDIGIVIPKNIKPLTADQEIDFFNKTCPIQLHDTYKPTYDFVFGTIASVMSNDFYSYCRSINELQTCSWKSAEILSYGTRVKNLMHKLRSLGCDAVGMSSMGPSIFFFSNDFDNTIRKITTEIPNVSIIHTRPRNFGREITYE